MGCQIISAQPLEMYNRNYRYIESVKPIVVADLMDASLRTERAFLKSERRNILVEARDFRNAR
jgi:hypothetical protein